MFEYILHLMGEQALAAAIAATLSSLLTLVIAYVLFKHPDLRGEIQAGADYVEKVEEITKTVAVVAAERMGLQFAKKGLDKAIFAMDVTEAALAAQGIQGDPKRVTLQRLRADIDRIAARIFPPKAEPQPAEKPAA